MFGLYRLRAPRKRVQHGLSHTAAYKSWAAIMDKCFNPAARDFSEFGGRGIEVCERWRSVENFIADMGEREEGLVIDRLDPNKNFEPGNCRWATPLEHARTQPNRRMIEFNGVRLHLAEWSRRLGVPENTIRNRIRAGKNIDGTPKQ